MGFHYILRISVVESDTMGSREAYPLLPTWEEENHRKDTPLPPPETRWRKASEANLLDSYLL